MLLCPSEMQGIMLIVVQHLYLVFGKSEEVAEIEQEDEQSVQAENRESLDEGISTMERPRANNRRFDKGERESFAE